MKKIYSGIGHISSELLKILSHCPNNNKCLKSPSGSIIGSEEDIKNLGLRKIKIKDMLLDSYSEGIVCGLSIKEIDQLRELAEDAGATIEEVDLAYNKAIQDPLYKLETHRISIGIKN